jgi:hypothetical protein
LQDTFWGCLEKFTPFQSPGRRFGLRDARVRLLFNDGIEIVQEVRLARALYSSSKEGKRMVEQICESLCARCLQSTEKISPLNPEWSVEVHTLLQVSLEPLDVCITEMPLHEDLFEGASLAHKPEDVCFSLRLKSSRWHPYRCSLQSSLLPQGAFALESSSENSLFAFAHQERPATFFIPAVTMPLATLDPMRIEYLESLQEKDYFKILPRHPHAAPLWVALPRAQRNTPWLERMCEVIGAFS